MYLFIFFIQIEQVENTEIGLGYRKLYHISTKKYQDIFGHIAQP